MIHFYIVFDVSNDSSLYIVKKVITFEVTRLILSDFKPF